MQKTEIICGKHAVVELLRSEKRKCFEIYVGSGKKERTTEEVEDMAAKRKVPIRRIENSALLGLTKIEKHQGVAAKVEAFQALSKEDLPVLIAAKPSVTFVILDGILDPQNIGSLLRSAHQLGIDAVIVPVDHSAPMGPAATRAAAGAIEYLPIVQVTNLVSTMNDLKEKGFWIYGAAMEGVPMYDVDMGSGSVAIILGSEGKGMRRLVKETCDGLISIPMHGQLGSLNVGVAGGILMAEVMRQRRRSQTRKKG